MSQQTIQLTAQLNYFYGEAAAGRQVRVTYKPGTDNEGFIVPDGELLTADDDGLITTQLAVNPDYPLAVTFEFLGSEGKTKPFTRWISAGSDVTLKELFDLGNVAPPDSPVYAALAGKADILAAMNEQNGASYTLLASDNGKVVVMDKATANTVIVPPDLPVGYNAAILQIGVGQTTIAASGTTLNSAQGLKIGARYGGATVLSYQTNVYAVAGNLAL